MFIITRSVRSVLMRVNVVSEGQMIHAMMQSAAALTRVLKTDFPHSDHSYTNRQLLPDPMGSVSESGFEPPTLWSLDNPLHQLS